MENNKQLMALSDIESEDGVSVSVDLSSSTWFVSGYLIALSVQLCRGHDHRALVVPFTEEPGMMHHYKLTVYCSAEFNLSRKGHPQDFATQPSPQELQSYHQELLPQLHVLLCGVQFL